MTPQDLDTLARALHLSRHHVREKRCDGASALKRLRIKVGPAEVEKGIAQLKQEGRA